MSLGVLRGVVLAVVVAGIAGMIVSTVATDNNNGWVITFGLLTAVASIALLAATAAVWWTRPRSPAAATAGPSSSMRPTFSCPSVKG